MEACSQGAQGPVKWSVYNNTFSISYWSLDRNWAGGKDASDPIWIALLSLMMEFSTLLWDEHCALPSDTGKSVPVTQPLGMPETTGAPELMV